MKKHKKNHRLASWLPTIGISLVIAFSACTSLVNHLLGMKDVFFRIRRLEELDQSSQIFYFILVTLIITILLIIILHGLINPLLRNFHKHLITIMMITTFLLSTVLIITSPGKVPLPPAWHRLEITASGGKNPFSNGTEVWLTEIRIADNDPLSLYQYESNNKWRIRPLELEYLVSDRTQPASLLISFQGGKVVPMDTVQVLFRSTQSSGMAILRLDDHEETIDLYEDIGGDTLRTLPLSSYDKSNPANRSYLAWRVILHLADVIVLAFILLLAGAYLLRLAQSPKRRELYILLCLSAFAIVLITFTGASPGLMKESRAPLYAINASTQNLHWLTWVLGMMTHLATVMNMRKHSHKMPHFAGFTLSLITLGISLLILTITPLRVIGGATKWSTAQVFADSSSYVSKYTAQSTRPPVYPLFIQAVLGEDKPVPLAEGTITDAQHPYVRIVRAQTLFLLASSILACLSLMLATNSILPSLLFLWLYDYGYYSQEINSTLSEPMAQAWMFLLVSSFLLFMIKKWKWFLPLIGFTWAGLFLTRPAGAFGGVLLGAAIIWGISRNPRAYWLPSLLSVILFALFAAAPSINTYFSTGSLNPPPMYSYAKIAFALQVADQDDIELMPDEESRQFLARALEKKSIEDEKIRSRFPNNQHLQTFFMLNSNVYLVASSTDALGESETSLPVLWLKVSNTILRRHRLDYLKIGWQSFIYAIMEVTRLQGIIPFSLIAFIISLMSIIIHGWVGFAAFSLFCSHIAHLVIIALNDVPSARYVYETEFLVILAIFLLALALLMKLFKPSAKENLLANPSIVSAGILDYD